LLLLLPAGGPLEGCWQFELALAPLAFLCIRAGGRSSKGEAYF
jgi:hypothetical protein